MVNKIEDLIENQDLLSKVLDKIEKSGYKETKIYKPIVSCEKNALCFYVVPSENNNDPFIKSLALNAELEREDFLGCQVEIIVKGQLSADKEKEINKNTVSVTGFLNNESKEKLRDLYKNVTLKPRVAEPLVNRKDKFQLGKMPPGYFKKAGSPKIPLATTMWQLPERIKNITSHEKEENVKKVKNFLESEPEILALIRQDLSLLETVKEAFIQENDLYTSSSTSKNTDI